MAALRNKSSLDIPAESDLLCSARGRGIPEASEPEVAGIKDDSWPWTR
jgi:hypothetical protein